jgi:hypothetical protein
MRQALKLGLLNKNVSNDSSLEWSISGESRKGKVCYGFYNYGLRAANRHNGVQLEMPTVKKPMANN